MFTGPIIKRFKRIPQFSLATLRQKLFSQPGTPHQLGLAFALGTFISILPTPGLNFLIASLMLSKWRHLHKAAMIASLGIWNTLVVAPLYTLSFHLGRWLFGSSLSGASGVSLFEEPLLWVQGFLVGNVVMAVATAVICYFVVKTAVFYFHPPTPCPKNMPSVHPDESAEGTITLPITPTSFSRSFG